MKELINKVFEEKMKDGSIEKIVSEQIEKMIYQICNEQMRYDGAAKKSMESKLSPLILQAVERSDLSNMVNKITLLINTALVDSELQSYQEVLESVRNMFAADNDCRQIRENKAVKLSEIFRRYKDYLSDIFEKDDFDDDEICDDGDGPTATVSCGISVEESESVYSWNSTKYDVELTCSKSNDKKSGDIHFKLHKKWDSNELYLNGDFRSLTLSDLRFCPKFILWLAFIEREYISVEIDIENDEDDVYIECR